MHQCQEKNVYLCTFFKEADISIGNRIKTARKHLHLTQEAFAIKCEISRSNLSRYEKGLVEPPFSFLHNLAKAFGINTRWLLMGEGEMFAQAPLSSGINASALEQLIQQRNAIEAKIKELLAAAKKP